MKRFRFLAHPVPPKQILNFETKENDFENFHSKYFSNNYPIETFVEWFLRVDALHITFS